MTQELEQPVLSFRPLNGGENPEGYTITAEITGDKGIYQELTVSIMDAAGNCVSETLFGLSSDTLRPVILQTDEGRDSSDDFSVAINPLEDKESMFTFY